jgi:hypothetical protein
MTKVQEIQFREYCKYNNLKPTVSECLFYFWCKQENNIFLKIENNKLVWIYD